MIKLQTGTGTPRPATNGEIAQLRNDLGIDSASITAEIDLAVEAAVADIEVGGITDGSKGDVVVSGAGTAWAISSAAKAAMPVSTAQATAIGAASAAAASASSAASAAQSTANAAVTAAATAQTAANSKASQTAFDALTLTVAGLSAGSSLPIPTTFAQAIPFDAYRSMGQQVVSGALTFTKNLTGSAVGGETVMTLIADGVNVPSFAAFTLAGSVTYDNTAGRVNEITFFRTPNGYYYGVLLGAIVDTTAPLESTATVENAAPSVVNILFDEDLDHAAAPPDASTFAVSAGHASVSTAWGAGNRTVALTVGTAFVNGEAARTLAYTRNGTRNLKDLSGNEVVNFTGKSITNNVAATDVTAPTLVSATVPDSDALRINLVWSEAMNSTVSAAAAFAISAGHTVTAHTYDTATTSHLTITTPFVQGEAARTLAYTQPGSNKMQDLAGNLLANIASASITNSVGTPTLVSAIVANATPGRIDLTWSESMNATVAAQTAFAVSAGHALTAHTYVDATHTYLTTSTAFVNGEAARTLAYTQPGSNQQKDLAGGNLVANFSGTSITNNVASAGFAIQDTFNNRVVTSGDGTDPAGITTRSDGGAWVATGASTWDCNSSIAGRAFAGNADALLLANVTHLDSTITYVGYAAVSASYPAIYCRYNVGGTDGMRVFFNPDGGNVQIFENGSQIANGPSGIVSGTDVTCSVVLSGSSIVAKVGGVTICSATMTGARLTQTYAGWLSGGIAFPNSNLDSFTAT